MMVFFELIGLAVVLYYVVNLILWLSLESDVELFIKEKTGKPISALRGHVVWVTGASSGIGKHLALVLAEHGVRLCLSARRETELDEVKRECLAVSKYQLESDDVLVLKMDMLDIGEHQKYFGKVLKHFGHIDILVNNAGRSQRAKWQEIPIEIDRQIFELDVFSVVNLTRIYVTYLLESKKKGHVAVTSSLAGLMAFVGSPSYIAAKYAVHGYFESLKIEHPNIDVTIFCPGATRTDFLAQAFTAKPGELYGKITADTANRMPAERCGFLFATALANKLFVNFTGPFPTNVVMYLGLYFPNLRRLMDLPIEMLMQMVRDPDGKGQ